MAVSLWWGTAGSACAAGDLWFEAPYENPKIVCNGSSIPIWVGDDDPYHYTVVYRVNTAPVNYMTDHGWYDCGDDYANHYSATASLSEGVNLILAFDLNNNSATTKVFAHTTSGWGLVITVGEDGCAANCGAMVTFEYFCLIPNSEYLWTEVITTSGDCGVGICTAGSVSGKWESDGNGYLVINDTAKVICPGSITQDCACTSYQLWALTYNELSENPPPPMSGNTTRVKNMWWTNHGSRIAEVDVTGNYISGNTHAECVE